MVVQNVDREAVGSASRSFGSERHRGGLSTGCGSSIDASRRLHHARLVKRLVLILLAVALLAPALVSASQLAQRRALRESLAAAGCFDLAIEQQPAGSQVVLALSVTDCVDDSGVDLPVGAAMEEVSEVAWSAPAAPFDALSVTVYRSRDSLGAASRMFSRDELQARWGPRASDLDWALPDLIRHGWFAYLALPVLMVILAVPVVLGVLAARRGVVVIFWRG